MDKEIRKAFSTLLSINEKLKLYYPRREFKSEIATVLRSMKYDMLQADKKYDRDHK